ncbi:MAG TPA: DUF4339 domain-containing protein [Candidatus Methylacidiphilales bacterium]
MENPLPIKTGNFLSSNQQVSFKDFHGLELTEEQSSIQRAEAPAPRMTVYITKNDQRLGPYSVEDLIRLKASGQLQARDWAWYEGLTEWIPLEQVPGVGSASQNALPQIPVSSPAIPVPQTGDSSLLIVRIATAVIIFGVLFVILFAVIFLAVCMVGGGIMGAQAAMAQHAQGYDQGAQIGREAGQKFGETYGGLIAVLTALISLILSSMASLWLAFSGILPWCRRR